MEMTKVKSRNDGDDENYDDDDGDNSDDIQQ